MKVRDTRVGQPRDLLPLLRGYRNRRQEHFIVFTLNGAHCVISRHVATVGLANRTLVHSREVFRWAIIDNACGIVLAHNHPSGNLDPSDEDREVTRRLTDAGAVIGIPVLDHIVFWQNGIPQLP